MPQEPNFGVQWLVDTYVCVCGWKPEAGSPHDVLEAHARTHYPHVTHAGELHHRVMALDEAHHFWFTNREARDLYARLDAIRERVLTGALISHREMLAMLDGRPTE